MSKRKILALLLAVAIICSLFVSPASAAEDAGEPVAISDNAGPLFTDIANHWSEGAINRWADYGIVKGYGDGTVRPDRTLKRDELATILSRLLGLKAKAPAGTFKDVPADAWYADAVLKCAAAGIMLGDGAGHANPESTIDRQQTIVMVARALGVKPSTNDSLKKFKDGNTVADWAAPYLTALTDLDILHGLPAGDDVVVAPADNINRAGVFTLLDKAISQYVVTPTTVTAGDPNKFVVINADAAEAVTVTGAAAGVVVAAGTTADVVADNLTVGTLKVDAPVDVTISKGSAVTDLDANAAATVANNGAVTNLNTNADDVTFDGNKPAAVNTAEDVGPAKDSKGNEVTTKPDVTTPSGGSSPSSVVRADLVAAPLHDNAANPIEDTDLGKVTVTSAKVSGKTNEYNVTITGTNIMNHQNADGNNGHWVGFGMPAAPEGETYTYKVDGVAKPAIAGRECVVGSKTYNTAYFSDTEEGFNTAEPVVVTVVNSEGETVATYNVSFKVTFKSDYAVSLKAELPKELLAAYDEATMPIRHKTAEGLGLTATVKGSTMTLTGETTVALLQNTVTGAAGDDGYVLYSLNVGNSYIKKIKAGAATYELTDFTLDGLSNAYLMNSKIYDGTNKELLSATYEIELLDANNRIQGKLSQTFDATAVTIEGMKKVTFKDAAGKTVATLMGETEVTAPAVPAGTDAIYYTGNWTYGDSGVVAAGATIPVTENITATAQYVEVKPTTISLRDKGPESHDPAVPEFDYPAAYDVAGITLDSKTGMITVDATKLIDMVNSGDADLPHIMGHGDLADYVVVGIAYETPTGAKKVAFADTLANLVSAANYRDLATHESCYNNTLISYIPVAHIDPATKVVTFATQGDSDYCKWVGDGDVVKAVTKTVITLKSDNMPKKTVTFMNGDETVDTFTVNYNFDDWKLVPALTDANNIFLGWFDEKGNKVEEAKALTDNLTLNAKWKWEEVITLTATPYDFSCPNGTTQYITFTLKNGDEPFYITSDMIEKCEFRAGRQENGEWTEDTVDFFDGDINDETAFEGMDKEHQLGWTVSRRTSENSTTYWRFTGTDGKLYLATFPVPKAIDNPTGASWGDTKVTEKDINVLPVTVPTTPETTPDTTEDDND